MSLSRRLLLAPVALAAMALAAPPAARAAPAAWDDPALAAIVGEALEKSPEYARARAEADAEQERVPQAGALPDPTLSLGIQNDGFEKIQIGVMETSWWQVMVTQPLPWPGKRGLREAAARAQADAVASRLERARLSITAEVERTHLDLLLARGQLELLAKQEALWREAEGMARTRYEVGSVPQSDLVRTQLERTRLVQQRIALEAVERARVAALNRLRVHPLDEPIAASARLADAPAPRLAPPDEAVADAEARSPDLAEARLAVAAAGRRTAAAERDRYPDLSLSAGIMPRGGLDPMWTASVGVGLPIFSGRKQARAVAEASRRREAEAQGEAAVRQLVALRARERHLALDAVLRTLALYRDTLLVQSDAAVRSTLSQYKVGKVPFASVLEVMRGLVADEGGFLDALAQAQRLAIADREVSLAAVGELGGGGAGGTVPGSAGLGGAGARAGGGGAKGEGAGAAAGGGGGMTPGM